MCSHGRGALEDRHALALTWMAGRAVLAEADLVLGVGTRFMAGTDPVSVPPAAPLILLNAERQDLGAPRSPTVAIHADAALAMSGLVAALDGLAKRRESWADLDRVRRWSQDILVQVEPQYSWVRALRASVPEDGILVNEFT